MSEIPEHCVRISSDIHDRITTQGRSIQQLTDAMSTMANDMTLVRNAVVGNGTPENSLLTRTHNIEKLIEAQGQTKKKGIDRGWAVALILIAAAVNGLCYLVQLAVA